jgi:hypothetical protein
LINPHGYRIRPLYYMIDRRGGLGGGRPTE